MSYGLSFINSLGNLTIDSTRIIPQFIGKENLGNYGWVDYDSSSGAHPGYTIRSFYYTFPNQYYGRPIIAFVTANYGNADVWNMHGSAQIFATGLNPAAPEIYYFALDSVSSSGSGYGTRIYGPQSQLCYDSGNRHLNIQQACTISVDNATQNGVDYPTGGITTAYMNSIPYKPAFVMPHTEMFVNRSNKVDGLTNWRANNFFRAVNGNALQTKQFRTEYEYEETGTLNPVYHAYGGATSLPSMVIDASAYD